MAAMDTGTIVTHQVGGRAVVSRGAEAPAGGVRLVLATNADALAAAAAQALRDLGVPPASDGVYPCPIELQLAAAFPPQVLPSDLVSFAHARDILYPDVADNTGWQRVRADVRAGRLRV